eukprot:1846175-Prymnesium_polylepis.1
MPPYPTTVPTPLLSQVLRGRQPGGFVPWEEGHPRPGADARLSYHPLPSRPKRKRGARPAAPLRGDWHRGIRRQILGKVHRRLPLALVRSWGP